LAKQAREKEKERYFLDLKTAKVLKVDGKSKYVNLMSDGCIKKRYDSTIADHEEHFRREVRILRHLARWPHSPRILWINRKKRTIYMTNCGPNPKQSPQLKGRLAAMMQELREEWSLCRRNYKGQVVNHIDIHNLCIKDDQLYIIDFGSPLWELR